MSAKRLMLRELSSKAKAIDLMEVSLTDDGRVVFKAMPWQDKRFIQSLIDDMSNGIRNPLTGETAVPADGEKFMRLLPYHFHGDYMWAEEVANE